jgi:hypothetical protein
MNYDDLVSVMFPAGQVVPNVGDTLKRDKDEWQVIRVGADCLGNTVITLRPTDGSQTY